MRDVSLPPPTEREIRAAEFEGIVERLRWVASAIRLQSRSRNPRPAQLDMLGHYASVIAADLVRLAAVEGLG